MKATVKRKTGFLGFATKVKLIIDGEQTAKLSNNDIYTVKSDKERVIINAKQFMTSGSPLEAREGDIVEITYNPICYITLLVSIVLLFLSGFATETSGLKLIFSGGGLVGLIVTIVYTLKAGFLLKKQRSPQN